MSTTTLEAIAMVIARLDERAHLTPSHLELIQGTSEDGGWVAQIIADPLPVVVLGWGATPSAALDDLAGELRAIDWRRVRGRPRTATRR